MSVAESLSPPEETVDTGEPTIWEGLPVLATGTMVILSTVLLSPGLDKLVKHLEEQPESFASPDVLGKVLVTAPAAVVALLAVFGGYLLDRVGRRPVLLAGLAIFGIAGCAGGLLSSPVALFGSRIALGLGLACILLSSTTLIGDYFDGHERRKMLGWQIAMISTTSVVCLFMAAFLVEYSWRYPFAIYGAAFALLPWAWAQVPEPSDEATSDDTAEEDDDSGSIAWHTIGLIYGGSFLALAIFHLATTQIPGYLEELGYGSPYMSAAIIGGMSVIGIPSSLLFDKVRDKISGRTLLLIVFGVGAVGFAIAGSKQAMWTLLVGLSVFSLPYGFRTPAFNGWLLDEAPAKYRGRLMGGLTAATFAGIFCSPLISNPLNEAVGMPTVILIAAVCQALFAAAFGYFALVRGKGESGREEGSSSAEMNGERLERRAA